jgi:hypothetical protein
MVTGAILEEEGVPLTRTLSRKERGEINKWGGLKIKKPGFAVSNTRLLNSLFTTSPSTKKW